MERLYIVVRRDLAPGAQLAQSAHALSAFAVEYPELHRDWHLNGKNLIALGAADEAELEKLLTAATDLGARSARFHEPDFGGSLTAIALSEIARPLVSSLPLALKQPCAVAA